MEVIVLTLFLGIVGFGFMESTVIWHPNNMEKEKSRNATKYVEYLLMEGEICFWCTVDYRIVFD